MKFKKALLIPLVFTCLLIIGIWALNSPPNRVEIARLDTDNDGRHDYKISLQGPKTIEWVKSGTSAKKHDLSTEETLVYEAREGSQSLGALTLTLKRIRNTDYIYFIKYENKRTVPDVKAIITALNSSPEIKGHQIIYPRQIDNQSSEWNSFEVSPGGRFSPEHRLPKNAVFLDSSSHYLRLGLVDIFKPLKNRVKLELFEKSKPISILRQGDAILYTIPLPPEPGTYAETWGILGSSPLIDWDNPSAVSAAKRGDLVRFRKLATDGTYYLTPWNYYPTEKTAFWPNPANHVAELFRRQDGGSYFTDISVSSMYTAIQAQNRDGFWPTYPRSDWLFKDYRIPEGFYDTRFNTDAALFLLHMYSQAGDKKSLEAAQKYGSWLRKYIQEQGIPTSGGGMLVPDYFKPGVKHQKSHVSLNHLVTEMNFLYELYGVDQDELNLKAGDLIRQAVRDTGENWIKPDGDLHYAYLSGGKYGMQDYPLITLNDLKLSQKLIKQVTGREDSVFGKLIESKENYLVKNGMPLE
ncbi:MAG: hypothetical protein CVU89_00650 [Firmicutes bacterium HGW-Firmicutes-14]|nr:MAG: hypothetical protein CVU89_00650 [Firmicutes bacterium HGW-Firmicutes-14]